KVMQEAPGEMGPPRPFGMTAPVPTYEGGNSKEGPSYDSAVVVPFRKKPEGEGHASLLARAVETGIRKICIFPKEEHYNDLSGILEVGVFPIDSTVVSGYLVIGWKGNEDLRREFLQQAETS